MISKSIFTNTLSIKRTLLVSINKVPMVYSQSGDWSNDTGGMINGNCNCCPSIPTNIESAINDIKNLYSTNLASNNYQNIPADYDTYMNLLYTLNSYTNYPCDSFHLLFSIVKDALIGSSTMSTLFQNNNELNITISILNKKIDDILSGVNKIKAIGNVQGTIEFKKTIKLAPLYSFYIIFFGVPAFGVGFNQDILTTLHNIIDTYGKNTLSYYITNIGVPNLGDGTNINLWNSFKNDISYLANILKKFDINLDNTCDDA